MLESVSGRIRNPIMKAFCAPWYSTLCLLPYLFSIGCLVYVCVRAVAKPAFVHACAFLPIRRLVLASETKTESHRMHGHSVLYPRAGNFLWISCVSRQPFGRTECELLFRIGFFGSRTLLESYHRHALCVQWLHKRGDSKIGRLWLKPSCNRNWFVDTPLGMGFGDFFFAFSYHASRFFNERPKDAAKEAA